MGRRGIALTGLLLAIALLRLRFLEFPLTRDEGDYAYMAQLWLQGVPPYSAAYDMRMPGIFAAYALALAVFGESTWGIHMGLLVVHLASVWVVFALGRRLLDARAAFAAALCFAALQLNPWMHGAIANTEHFVLLPALAGVLLLLRGLESRRHATLGAAGLLLGLAAVTKQNAALWTAFAALLVLWRAPSRLPALLIGAALPLAAVGLLLALSGSFASFWFWTVIFPFQYATAVPLESAWPILRANWLDAVRWTLGFWLLAAVGLAALSWPERAGLARVFLPGLLGFSFLSLAPGFFFRSQHFQLLLPAVALLCGVAVSTIGARVEARLGPGAARAAMAALLLLPLATFLVGDRELLFRADGRRASRMLFGWNPFPESPEIARYLAEHGAEDDTVAIFGSEPQIYFHARRRSATPFILVYAPMQPHERARSMQRQMIDALEAAKPRHLVFVNVPQSWGITPESERLLLDWFARKVARDYRLVGQIDILSAGTEYLWDEAVGDGRAGSGSWVSVWERRDAGSGHAP